MNLLLVNKFVEVTGLLGSIKFKLFNYNYIYTVLSSVVCLLFKIRRSRRVFISNVQRYSRDLCWGLYRPLDMFGMGLKYEWWLYNLRMTLGFTHHVILEEEGGYIVVIGDKIAAFFSGHVEYLNVIHRYVKCVNPLSKYKEKGIIDPKVPANLRKRKEKRR